MAKGNDGNYLQHCIEVEAAVRLARTGPYGQLHISLTHGMEPFEQICEPNRNAHRLLYGALREAAGEPQCNEREIVKAYRASWKRRAYRPGHTDPIEKLKREKYYPNTAELLRTVIGTDRLSGGITEKCAEIHEALVQAWSGSGVVVAHSSWRKQLDAGGALGCPEGLDAPWLFSMDPMTYAVDGDRDDANLNRSDLGLLESALGKYFDSGQPGIACFFVYKMGTQNKSSHQRQFWAFVDELAARLEVQTCSYWVAHQCGSLNLAGLLFSDKELALGFVPPGIKPGRVRSDRRHGTGMLESANRPISDKHLIHDHGRFSRHIGIDYSGAGTADQNNRGLQVFAAEDANAEPVRSPGESGIWTRRQVAEFCAEKISGSEPVIIGIDHAFSLPESYMERYDIRSWDAFLDDFREHWPTDHLNMTVKSLREGNPRTGNVQEFRLVERWTASAKSVFQFDVPGQVATSTHAGIPWLRWLRRCPDIGSRIHFWPFDGFDVPDGMSVIAEVYPSLFRKRYDRRESRSADEHDAFVTAAWLHEMDRRDVLGTYFRPPLSSSEEEAAHLEGWILGVW